MKIYFAGAQSKQFLNVLGSQGVKNVLISYWETKNDKNFDMYSKFNLFVDSGGFTARQHGLSVDVEDYGRFIKKHNLKTYANLDLKKSEDTVANQHKLEAMGLHPIPVYHFEEWARKDYGLFDYYIKKYNYIALGGVAGAMTKRKYLFVFLDWVFYRTQNKIKVHGFGMTDNKLVANYPFYSVDSTSWLTGGRYNYVFDFTKGKVKGKGDIYRPLKYYERDIKNIKSILAMEKHINGLWERRGVEWQN